MIEGLDPNTGLRTVQCLECGIRFSMSEADTKEWLDRKTKDGKKFRLPYRCPVCRWHRRLKEKGEMPIIPDIQCFPDNGGH